MKKMIDLTMPIINGMSGVNIEPSKTIKKNGCNSTNIHLYSHSGTHVDAPAHFIDGGKTLEQIPLEKFRAKAHLLEIKNVKNKQLLKLKDFESIPTNINKGDALIIKTNWSKKSNLKEYKEELPRISPEFAVWCVEKKISILGIEQPSVADIYNIKEVTEIHQILLKADILIVESLCNLEKIKTDSFEFMVLPLPITGGDGSPARAIALV